MTSWRDIAGELTPIQIAWLEDDESHGEISDDALLFMAREASVLNLEVLLDS